MEGEATATPNLWGLAVATLCSTLYMVTNKDAIVPLARVVAGMMAAGIAGENASCQAKSG
ncbi:hypothetical protein HaLaN_06499, partial [Haematococcus lacustris]